MTDELIDAIDEANRGAAPSPFGKMEFVIIGAPVSVQSTKTVREAYIKSIKDQFSNISYLLTGELMLEVVWLVPAKSRFETDAKADIDNCIKPIIDALTGPDALFIDDCQLKGLYICWRHIDSQDERLILTFEYHPDDFCSKDELVFLKLGKGLCSPASTNWSLHARTLWVNAMKMSGFFKTNLEAHGAPYLAVAGFLGNSRPFHITRVQKFRIMEFDEFVAEQ